MKVWQQGRSNRAGEPSGPASGFTLIEVLVSLAIFALAAVVLGTAYVNVLSNFQKMQAQAGDGGEAALVRALVLAEPDRKKAEKGGEMSLLAGGRLHWDATVEETAVADLFRVSLAVEIAPGGKAAVRRRDQEFLVLRPTWSDPAKREKLRAASRERLVKSRS